MNGVPPPPMIGPVRVVGLHKSPASTDASAKGLSKFPASVDLSLVVELDEDEPQAPPRQATSRLRAGRDQVVAARLRVAMSTSFEVDGRRARTNSARMDSRGAERPARITRPRNRSPLTAVHHEGPCRGHFVSHRRVDSRMLIVWTRRRGRRRPTSFRLSKRTWGAAPSIGHAPRIPSRKVFPSPRRVPRRRGAPDARSKCSRTTSRPDRRATADVRPGVAATTRRIAGS